MMAAVRRMPVVVILGATGTGKSKLAIELGRKFNGEIISADSMQIYEGLDIITNKVTEEEQEQCRHHLISYVNPFNNISNTVVQFRDKALPIVDRLLEEGKLPIIVGGTNYYIESLLWNFLVDDKVADESDDAPPAKRARTSSNEDNSAGNPSEPSGLPTTDASSSKAVEFEADAYSEETKDTEVRDEESSIQKPEEELESVKKLENRGNRFKEFESVELHKQLTLVDPVSAKRIHPHNRRKIIRALEVYEKHGVPMSDIYRQQHSEVGDSALSGPLRYKNTCIFWIQCDKEVLDTRLDRRVDGMVKQGLLKELHDFHQQYKLNMQETDGNCDYTLGMFQSIGFKEFHDYLLLSEEERNTVKGKQLQEKGFEALKLATRQYARRQIKWIRNRFLRRPGPGGPHVYGVDSTDVDQWTQNVYQPAIDTLASIIQGEVPELSPLKLEGGGTVHVHNVCDVCGGRVFTTQQEWDAHLASKKHKKLFIKQQKEAKEMGQSELSQSTTKEEEQEEDSKKT